MERDGKRQEERASGLPRKGVSSLPKTMVLCTMGLERKPGLHGVA
jgi:hypothetical protein